jgi:hypothetical protein
MDKWILSFTPKGKSGREIGQFASRNDALIAGDEHYQRAAGNAGADDDLGWQMSFNGATALTDDGAYRVRRG